MMQTDRLDRQLVHALGIDGRASFAVLARALGASEQTVARRYARLRAAGVVRVVALPRPAESDLGQVLRLSVRPGSGAALARALSQRDDVAWVRTAAAGTEVVCGVRAADPRHRDRLVLDQIPGTGRVTAVAAHAVLHHVRTPGRADWDGFDDPLDAEQRTLLTDRSLLSASPGGSPVGTDEAVLRALADDARRPVTEVARATGLPASTARRHVQRLLADGVVVLDRDVDQTALGRPVGANLYLEVSPRRLEGAGRDLAAHPQTTFVAAVSGSCNLLAAVACRDIGELYRYTSVTLATLPGVRRIETSLTVRYLKQARTVVSAQ